MAILSNGGASLSGSNLSYLIILGLLALMVWVRQPSPPHNSFAVESPSLELQALEQQIQSLEYENIARNQAVLDAKSLMAQYPRQPEPDRAAVPSSRKPHAQQVQDACASWAHAYSVQPGVSWGTLPDSLRQEWLNLRCQEHVSQPSHAAEPSRIETAPQVTMPDYPRATSSYSTAAVTPSSAAPYSYMAGASVPAPLAAVSRAAVAAPSRRDLESALLPPAVSDYKGYTFWSSDFHISPIADLKDLFKPLHMNIIDKSLSGHCHLKKTCATGLKVINKGNGIALGKCPNQFRRAFFEAYKNDKLMAKVDAMLCHHAAPLCEAFMPFNKSLVVVASTRFEIGRHDPKRWKLWNENLRAIAAHPRNVVAANNKYDAEYVKYFTGLKDVPVLPNYCAYTKVSYSPTRSQVLIGPGRGIKDQLYRELKAAARGTRFASMARLRDLYPHFEYKDLAAHPAIVLIPYQVSIMSLFEYYRMAIPLFVPSPSLLAQWQVKHRVMDERTWNGVFKKFKRSSDIPQHPDSHVPYDPNNEFDHAAIKHWIAYADFYTWPHITQFDSFSDLMAKLAAADLNSISAAMKVYNLKTKKDLVATWQKLFHKMFHGRQPAAQQPLEQIQDYDQAMMANYGVKVSGGCIGDSHGQGPLSA